MFIPGGVPLARTNEVPQSQVPVKPEILRDEVTVPYSIVVAAPGLVSVCTCLETQG